MEYYTSYKFSKVNCTSLEWKSPTIDNFDLIRAQNRADKPTITKYSFKPSSRLHRERSIKCNKKERFLRGRFWSPARQRDLLTERISFERLKNYIERLAVNG